MKGMVRIVSKSVNTATVLACRIVPALFSVYCPVCGEQIGAPDTQLDRLAWTPTEVRDTLLVLCKNGHSSYNTEAR